MNKEIATRWVKALRSGKYKQGKNALKYKTARGAVRHCCLGVLCELYNQDKKRKQKPTISVKPAAPYSADLPDGCSVYAFAGNSTTLPTKVMQWAGMHSNAGEIADEFEDESLAEINDDGYSFKKIAQIIEDRVDDL